MKANISVRLNPCEYWYLRQYATEQDRSMPDLLRVLLHDHIIKKEGRAAAVQLLRGEPPD